MRFKKLQEQSENFLSPCSTDISKELYLHLTFFAVNYSVRGILDALQTLSF